MMAMKKIIIATIIILNFFNMNAQTTFEGLKHHSKQPYLTLNNGVRMPQFGLGLYMIAEGDEAYNAVLTALDAEKRYFVMSYEDQVRWFSQWNPTD